MAASDESCEKLTLYDMPVSNNGWLLRYSEGLLYVACPNALIGLIFFNRARVRMVIYYKGIEDHVRIVAPGTLGGLKSAEYLALNPQGGV
jgi:hypothetical protein